MMKQTWILVLALLMFGVGFLVGVITLQIVEGSSPTRKSDRHRSKGHHRPGTGSLLGSVQGFASELELSDEQESRLEAMLSEATTEVKRHEQAVSEYLFSQRQRVDELLTEDQRQSLEQLVDEKWASYRREKVQRMKEWFESETELGSDQVAQVEIVLRASEERKGECFRALKRDKGFPSRVELENGLEDVHARRDEKLLSLITLAQLEEFKKVWCSGRSMRRHRPQRRE